MRQSIIPVLAAIALAAVASAQPNRVERRPAWLVVRGATVVDGAVARPNMTILVRDGRIVSVTEMADSKVPGEVEIDGRGLYAIPGLFDAHVHLSPAKWERRVEDLRRLVEGGVTSVWDVAGDARQTADFARAQASGDIVSPSIDYCALMAGPAFFSDPRVVASSVGFVPGEAPWNRAVTQGLDLVQAVAAARGTGATCLKLYADLDAPDVQRITAEAHRQHLRVVAHATVFPAKPSDLVHAGVDVLAHSAYLVWEGSAPTREFTRRAAGDFAHVAADSPAIERLLGAMKSADVALNPTLWIFGDGPASRDEAAPARKAWMNAVTRRASQLGVRIVAGTDALFAPGETLPALHRELEAMVAGAGLTPARALAAATIDAARAVGVDRDRGSLDPGKAADIVLLSANPLDDIRNTTKIAVVIEGGRVVRQPATATPGQGGVR